MLGGLYGLVAWLPPRTSTRSRWPSPLTCGRARSAGAITPVPGGDLGALGRADDPGGAPAPGRLHAGAGPRPKAAPAAGGSAAGSTLSRDLPGPSLDFNPVLWREWHRNRPSRWARVVGLPLRRPGGDLQRRGGRLGIGRGAVRWVNGLQVSIGLLLLSVTAATSLAEERVRGSLDVLMATPLSTRQIVLGKWLGSFRQVPLLAVLPGLVILGCAGRTLERWPGCVVMVAYVLAAARRSPAWGWRSATWCSRLGRAVGLTVAAYVLVTVGWMFLVMALMRPHAIRVRLDHGQPVLRGGLDHQGVLRAGTPRPHRLALFWSFVHALAASSSWPPRWRASTAASAASRPASSRPGSAVVARA